MSKDQQDIQYFFFEPLLFNVAYNVTHEILKYILVFCKCNFDVS